MSRARRTVRAALETYYRHAGPLRVDRLVAPLEARFLLGAPNADVPVRVEGVVPEMQFLVATSSKGVLLWKEGRFTQLLGGAWYGLTRHDSWWYGFRKARLHGHILRFRIVGGRARDVSVVATGLSRGVHQIDFLGDSLVVVDTYENRVIEMEPGAPWRRPERLYYPDGALTNGRSSDNYHHFNSILGAGERRFLVAHNETVKTGMKSDLWEVGPDYEVAGVTPLDASNAHNYVRTERGELWCASLEGTLRRDGADVLDVGMFTRGLAVSDTHTLVGGSVVELDRDKRDDGPGAVFVLDAADRRVGTIEIEATQVHEIRFVDRADLGLSNDRPQSW